MRTITHRPASLSRGALLGLVLAATPLSAAIENFYISPTFVREIEPSPNQLLIASQHHVSFFDISRAESAPPRFQSNYFFLAGEDPVTRFVSYSNSFFGGTSLNRLVALTSYSQGFYSGFSIPGWVMPEQSPFALSANKLYYGLGNAPEFPTATTIYRRSTNVAATPELYYNNVTTIRAMVSLNQSRSGYADIAFLDSTGNLKRTFEYPVFNPGGPATVGKSTVTIATNVQAIAVLNSRLYWTERDVSDVKIVRLKSGIGGGLGVPMTVTTYSPARSLASAFTLNELAITPDGNFAFMQEVVGTTRKLIRKNLTNTSAFAELEVASSSLESFAQLSCTNAHVYFIRSNTIVSRVATNSPAVTRDLVTGGLEVVQAIQNATNSCPLVQGKITHARFFARIASSTTGETGLPANAMLYGSSGGTPLPGSPLRPVVGPAQVSSAVMDRTQDEVNCWTFQLPDSWTRGTVSLVGQINDGRTYSETTYTNNFTTATVSFQNSGSLEVRFVPTKTVHGTVRRTLPEYQRALDNLTNMLPASKVNYTWRGGELSRPLVPFYCNGNGRFEVRAGFDDSWLMLGMLLLNNAMDVAGPNIYYVSLLPTFEGKARWDGIALPGIYDINLSVPASGWFLNLDDNEMGQPFMSGTAAQELAHNFGRLHVDCDNPDFLDFGYPYPPDTLSSPAAGYIGMDPLTHKLIGSAYGKDYMSYCSPKWTSDYTWRALLAHMPVLPPSSPFAPAALTTGFELACGHVESDGTTYLLPITPLPGSLSTATRLTSGPDYAAWKVRFSLGEKSVGDYPVKVFEAPADSGAEGEGTTFLARVDPAASEFDSMELVRQSDGAVLGSRSAGVNAPNVSLVYPLGGETIPQGSNPLIKWTASDPDGDDVQTTVRWSNDQGATWTTLVYGTIGNELPTEGITLPGGAKPHCRVQVITTDGLHSKIDESGDFFYGNNPPTLAIQVITPRATNTPGVSLVTILAGENVTLHGIAGDVEDVTVIPTWQITTPNLSSLSGYGEFVPLSALLPGEYLVTCNVADSAGDQATAEVTLKVRPRAIPMSSLGLTFNGAPTESNWSVDATPTPLVTGSGTIPVRFVHTGNELWISASGIPDGTAVDTFFEMVFDLNNNASVQPDASDLRVKVFATGVIQAFKGNGTTWVAVDPLSVPEGIISTAGGFWSFELRIPDSQLGGWSGQTVGGALFFNRGTSAFTSNAWPAAASLSNPSTWTKFLFGTDPESPADIDADGVPDAYEFLTYGSAGYDPVKNKDTDGDGQSDINEMIAGTNPLDATSSFAAFFAQGGLIWNSAPCRSYTVSTSTDLENWEPILVGLTYGYFQLPQGSGTSSLFYRITADYAR